VPSREEIEHPNLDHQQLEKRRQKYDFEGEYHCKLCPRKILSTETDLKDHLTSKVSQLDFNSIGTSRET